MMFKRFKDILLKKTELEEQYEEVQERIEEDELSLRA